MAVVLLRAAGSVVGAAFLVGAAAVSTQTRLYVAEILVYALFVWASYEMAKTEEQRRESRLKRLLQAARVCQVGAYALGRAGMRCELAYYQEVNS